MHLTCNQATNLVLITLLDINLHSRAYRKILSIMREKLILFGFFLLITGLVQTNAAKGTDLSLLGWWKLDDGEGVIVFDSSGKENHGTINNPNGGLGTRRLRMGYRPESQCGFEF